MLFGRDAKNGETDTRSLQKGPAQLFSRLAQYKRISSRLFGVSSVRQHRCKTRVYAS